MNKLLGIVTVVLVAGLLASAVYAKNLPEMTSNNRMEYKDMLKQQLKPVNHGYGIGFTESTYLTAKWYITGVRTLDMGKIKEMIRDSNATDWSQLKNQIQTALSASGVNVNKGRIVIGKTTYILTEMNVTNSTVAANIRSMPIYSNCKDQNMTVDQCESISTQVGYFSLAKKTNAVQTLANDPKVWAGTLNFNSTTYTFVTFAYPIGESNDNGDDKGGIKRGGNNEE